MTQPAPVVLWRDMAEGDRYDAEWYAMAPSVPVPPGYEVYHALPVADFDALVADRDTALARIKAMEERVATMREALEQVAPDWLPATVGEVAEYVYKAPQDVAIRLIRARAALAEREG